MGGRDFWWKKRKALGQFSGRLWARVLRLFGFSSQGERPLMVSAIAAAEGNSLQPFRSMTQKARDETRLSPAGFIVRELCPLCWICRCAVCEGSVLSDPSLSLYWRLIVQMNRAYRWCAGFCGDLVKSCGRLSMLRRKARSTKHEQRWIRIGRRLVVVLAVSNLAFRHCNAV